MRKLLLLFNLLTFLTIIGVSQEIKKDNRPQVLKEDNVNLYNSERISELDIIQALDMAGIRINKFYFGEFDKKYNYIIILEEFKSGELFKTDTLLSDDNQYVYWDENENMFYDYLDQIKFITKEEENKCAIRMINYARSLTTFIEYKKEREDQYYRWRSYSSTNWELDKKIPLMVFASSWFDSYIGRDRFCGIVDLSRNEEMTKELLTSSPHYFLISYKVSEIEND